MHTSSIKSVDELIQGISIILSKYRCSFSDDELTLLNQCIEALENGKTESDPLKQLQVATGVVSTIIRVFTWVDHFKDLF